MRAPVLRAPVLLALGLSGMLVLLAALARAWQLRPFGRGAPQVEVPPDEGDSEASKGAGGQGGGKDGARQGWSTGTEPQQAHAVGDLALVL